MPRSDRRDRFAEGLASGKSAVAAYVDAGYATNGANWERNATRLRWAADIQDKVRKLTASRVALEERAARRAVERLAITKEAMARELLPLAGSNIQDYLELDQDGKPLMAFDLSRATLQQMKAIRSLTIETVVRGKGADQREVEKVRLVLHDKVPAHVTLARLFGWLLDPAREAPPSPYEQRLRQMTPEQRAEEGAKLIDRARQRLLEYAQETEATDLEPDGEGGFSAPQ